MRFHLWPIVLIVVSSCFASCRRSDQEPAAVVAAGTSFQVPAAGTSKSDVIKRLGRPKEWGKLHADGSLGYMSSFSPADLEAPMTPDEVWMFGFQNPNGSKFSLTLKGNKVMTSIDAGVWR